MAKANEQTQEEFIKILYVGDSGTGKTGSLISLIEAGYDIRMLDFDNGVASLTHLIKKRCPQRLSQLDYILLRDKFKADTLKGIVPNGKPRAFIDAMKFLNKWDDESLPEEWGPNTVFVLDSLTSFGQAAFLWAQSMNPTAKDGRQWYGTAQDAIRRVLDMVTSQNFGCHTIVMSHIQDVELSEGVFRSQCTSIGKALGPDVPKVFNIWVQAEARGTGGNVRRSILTQPNNRLELKTTIPWELEKSLELDSGLATIFEKLRNA